MASLGVTVLFLVQALAICFFLPSCFFLAVLDFLVCNSLLVLVSDNLDSVDSLFLLGLGMFKLLLVVRDSLVVSLDFSLDDDNLVLVDDDTSLVDLLQGDLVGLESLLELCFFSEFLQCLISLLILWISRLTILLSMTLTLLYLLLQVLEILLYLVKSLDDLDSLSTVSVVSSGVRRSNLVSDKLAGLSVLLSFKATYLSLFCLKILNFFSSFLHDFF